MKKLFILLFSLGLAYGASAQRGGGHAFAGGGFHGGYYAPRVYYAPAYYGRGPMPPALSDQIAGIRSDYKAEIKDVKHDKALSHSDKQAKVNDLEKQRDAAITQARHDFFNAQMRKPAPSN